MFLKLAHLPSKLCFSGKYLLTLVPEVFLDFSLHERAAREPRSGEHESQFLRAVKNQQKPLGPARVGLSSNPPQPRDCEPALIPAVFLPAHIQSVSQVTQRNGRQQRQRHNKFFKFDGTRTRQSHPSRSTGIFSSYSLFRTHRTNYRCLVRASSVSHVVSAL